MAISKLTGQMLNSVLVRDGVNLAFTDSANSVPTFYIDVGNSFIGVNTSTPNTAFTINGAGYASSFNLTSNLSLGGDVTSNGNITANVNVIAVNLSASGNVSTVNFIATGNANAVNISASGNINAFANVNVGGDILASNATIGNITSTTNLSVSGNASIFSLTTTNFSVTGNTTSTDLNLSGNLVANTITANLEITTANLSATGTVTLGNVTSNTNSNINITPNGNGVVNLGNLSVNNTTLTSLDAGNLVTIGGVEGLVLPIGNSLQRPGTPAEGTTRFNTDDDSLETWDGTQWVVGSSNPSTYVNQQITGDTGTTYTLLENVSDNNNIIVSINGILQAPTTAYTVVGNAITFANPLLSSDIAEVRFLTFPVPSGTYGNADVAAYLVTNTGNISAGYISVTGNIVSNSYILGNGAFLTGVTGNGNYSNANVEAYLPTYAGDLGNVVNITATGNVDAVTANIGNLTSSNVYVTGVVSAAGNVRGGNINTVGLVSATGNITGNYFIGNGSQLTGLPATYGNSNVAAYLPTYFGVINASIITATGNIRANYFVGNGSQLTGIVAYPTGNLSGNLLANGFFLNNLTALSVNGNVFGNNIVTTGEVSSAGNVIAVTYTGTTVSVTGNVTAATFVGNLSAETQSNISNVGNLTTLTVTGNVTANYFVGNGSQLTDLYSNTNAAAYISTYTGNVSADAITATGNITANYFVGNGSQLTDLYSNTNAGAYISTYTGNVSADAITATGNITANYFVGNGSQLTGMYSNAEAGDYISTYTGNISANIITATGNISGDYFVGNGSQLTGLTIANVSSTGNILTIGSSGPQDRLHWDTFSVGNTTSALSTMTPPGSISGNSAFNLQQPWGLDLTGNAATQFGTLYWNSNAVTWTNNITLTASIAASGGSAPPADGIGFVMGGSSMPVNSGTISAANGSLTVFFHYFAYRVEVYVNGVQTLLPFVPLSTTSSAQYALCYNIDATFNTVKLKLRKQAGLQTGRILDIYMNDVWFGAVDIGSWTPGGNYFGAVAYTGANYALHSIRSFDIEW